ncbi:MAG: response regulator [Cryomorphaceae bacterium]|nr:MAG: response regulator [Cryomorphaceae bacterium]
MKTVYNIGSARFFMFVLRGCFFLVLSSRVCAQPESDLAADCHRQIHEANALLANHPDSAFAIGNDVLAADCAAESIVRMNASALVAEAAQQLGKYDLSSEFFLRAIELARSENDPHKLASFYNGLASNFYYLGNLPKAANYLQQAADFKLQAGDLRYYAVVMGNLATIYHAQVEHDKAMIILRNAEQQLFKDSGDEVPFYTAGLYNAMGSIQQVGLSHLDSAAYYFEKALLSAQMHEDLPNEITARHNLGEVYTHLGKLQEARSLLEGALEMSEQASRPYITLNIYRSLAFLHEKMGNYQRAYDYKKQQLELREELYEDETRNKVEQLETQFRTALKDEQIERQQSEILQQQLEAEKFRSRWINLLLGLLVLLLITAMIALYYYQRKRSRERLEEAKARIYQHIVHDIRTPLSLITGPLNKIRHRFNAPEFEEDFILIERNARRLVNLVNELLEVSRLDSGRYRLAVQQGNPVEFIRGLAEAFRAEAEANGVSLQVNAPEVEANYRFPANALEHITANLVSNAIKFTPLGGEVRVTVSLNPQHDLMIEVSDNGPGIAEEWHERIFERFNRGEAGKDVPGTGVGLSVVRELSNLVDASVKLSSEPGKGTTFTVSLNLGKPVLLPEQMEDVEELPDERPLVLLVEDDPDMATFTAGLLRAEYRVLHVSNGVEGLATALREMPDVILTDVVMPGMDGIEMLRKLRANTLCEHIPVIVFSAKSSVQSRVEGLEAGAITYLAKPFHPDELMLQCRNLFAYLEQLKARFQESTGNEDITLEERLSAGNPYLKEVVEKLLARLDDSAFGVPELSDAMHLSRSQLHRKIKSLTGHSTGQFMRVVRLEKAHELLKTTHLNVTEVAYACGFGGQSQFTRSFTQHFGFAPSKLS